MRVVYALSDNQIISVIFRVLNMRVIANLVIISLILWSIYIAFMAFKGVTVYFPLIVSEDEEIPFHRLQSMRIAVLLTFSYYGFRHLLKLNNEVYPINFLITYLSFLIMSAPFIFYWRQVPIEEYVVIGFFAICLAFCYIASRPLIRDIFRNK